MASIAQRTCTRGSSNGYSEVDDQHADRDADDRDGGDAEHEAVVAGIDGVDQQRADARIAEHLLGDDGAVEDAAERHGKAGDLRHERVAHHVGRQDAPPVDAGELGIDDVVLA